MADTDGSHCPIESPCQRCRLERIQPALAELDVEKTHNRILRSHAAENAVKMEAALARIAELEKALRETKYTGRSHSAHFDRTGQHGRGCLECIQAREAVERVDQLLDPAALGGDDKEPGNG